MRTHLQKSHTLCRLAREQHCAQNECFANAGEYIFMFPKQSFAHCIGFTLYNNHIAPKRLTILNVCVCVHLIYVTVADTNV